MKSKHRPERDHTLYLIREELKSRKFFNTLRKLGLQDCYYQPDLSQLIIENLALNDGSDEAFLFCYDVLNKYSERIDEDEEMIIAQALEVYNELVGRRN